MGDEMYFKDWDFTAEPGIDSPHLTMTIVRDTAIETTLNTNDIIDDDEFVMFECHLYSIVMDGSGARRTIFHKFIEPDTALDTDE